MLRKKLLYLAVLTTTVLSGAAILLGAQPKPAHAAVRCDNTHCVAIDGGYTCQYQTGYTCENGGSFCQTTLCVPQ